MIHSDALLYKRRAPRPRTYVRARAAWPWLPPRRAARRRSAGCPPWCGAIDRGCEVEGSGSPRGWGGAVVGGRAGHHRSTELERRCAAGGGAGEPGRAHARARAPGAIQRACDRAGSCPSGMAWHGVVAFWGLLILRRPCLHFLGRGTACRHDPLPRDGG